MKTDEPTQDPPDKTEWVKSDPAYAGVPGMDPYTEWALGAGRDSFFLPERQQRWMPVLVRLNGISPKDFADGQKFVDDGLSLSLWRQTVRVSPLYANRDGDERGPAFCTAMVGPGFFEFMKRNERLRGFVARLTIGLPLDDESLPSRDPSRETESP